MVNTISVWVCQLIFCLKSVVSAIDIFGNYSEITLSEIDTLGCEIEC